MVEYLTTKIKLPTKTDASNNIFPIKEFSYLVLQYLRTKVNFESIRHLQKIEFLSYKKFVIFLLLSSFNIDFNKSENIDFHLIKKNKFQIIMN